MPGPRRRAALGHGPGVLLQDASPEAIQILLEEVQFSWHETLGVPPNAEAGTIRRAWARLAHAYHPDKGGTQEQMARINAASAWVGGPLDGVRTGRWDGRQAFRRQRRAIGRRFARPAQLSRSLVRETARQPKSARYVSPGS